MASGGRCETDEGPADDPSASDPSPTDTSAEDAPPDDRPTVLLVDDEPAIADGHAAVLEEEAGYDTRTAYRGDEALEVMDDDVDAVVLDRRMPGATGREVLESIRDAGYDCRVVMLTGVEPDADVVEMGFDAYVVKPVDEGELAGTIDDLLAERGDGVDDEILDALGDPKVRRCCDALVEEPLSARELAETTGFSLPTVYRRLNALTQAGIVETQRAVDPEGGHYKTFTAVPTQVRVEIDDRVRVDVQRTDEYGA